MSRERRSLNTHPSPLPPAVTGFTLVEVLVALAIAGGALILLMGVNQNANQAGSRARERMRQEQAGESVLEELLLLSDPPRQGVLESVPGWTWTLRRESAGLESVAGLERWVFVMNSESGTSREPWVVYRHWTKATQTERAPQ